ncbi:MAG: SHOCT domain-containing protein [Acidimicrobiia bacterium]
MINLLLATHHFGGLWFPIFPLFFIGLWIVVFLVFGRRWRHSERRSGESMLAERYARGEIDETEYRQRRDVLRQR